MLDYGFVVRGIVTNFVPEIFWLTLVPGKNTVKLHYMKKITVFLAAVSLTGCLPAEPPSQELVNERTAYIEHRVTFHKHASGLCFAVLTYDRSMSITNIPCQSGDTVYVK